MKIPLTRNKYAIIDDEDYDKVKNYSWQAKWNINSKRFVVVADTIYMSRILTNCPDGMVVNHINHNQLDNRKSNLRICTKQQSLFNKEKHSVFSSKYKGVCWHKKSNKWIAQIGVNYKTRYLGTFKNEEDAAIAYNEAALKYGGDFAYINII